jgi:uncharacterized protein YbjT (DUF2867 family)
MSQPARLRRLEGMDTLTIAVTGGTGTLGSLVVGDLRARGHRVRALSRHTDHPVDLTTGAGLAEALDGCDVVVDAANSAKAARATLVEGTLRLLDAARDAGVGHYVGLSIVGCEAVPMGYFEAKATQQQLVEGGPLPWTTVRSTQFHDYVVATLTGYSRWGLTLVPPMRVQPVDVAEVATLVADSAERAPLKGEVTIAGPEIRDLGELAGVWRSAARAGTRLLRIPMPGKAGRALRSGALTTRRADVCGSVTFEQWLGRARAFA